MAETFHPKTLSELAKLMARHGKKSLLLAGIDAGADRIPAGRVPIDVSNVAGLHELGTQRNRVVIGTGVSLGRLSREAVGENGLLRQAASLVANPLVRNRVTLIEALDPESIYFDISTPLALLDCKVRLQGPNSRRHLSIRDFLEAAANGLRKGELPVQVDFNRLPPEERVGFFRVQRMSGKGTVSAAARMQLARGICKSPEIVVSSLTLIPVRSRAAEKAIHGQPATEDTIKLAAAAAADEVQELAESRNPYERSLVEICVARTLRRIFEA